MAYSMRGRRFVPAAVVAAIGFAVGMAIVSLSTIPTSASLQTAFVAVCMASGSPSPGGHRAEQARPERQILARQGVAAPASNR